MFVKKLIKNPLLLFASAKENKKYKNKKNIKKKKIKTGI